MDVLIVTSELAPYVRVGGVADVIAALSKALRLLGHKVTIAMPRYAAFERSGLMLARRLTPLSVPGSAGVAPLEVREGWLWLGLREVLPPGTKVDWSGLFASASGLAATALGSLANAASKPPQK